MRRQAHHVRQATRPAAEELVGRMAAGDSAAFATLYDRLAPALFGMLLRILPDRRSAEDALEQAFLQLAKQAAALARAEVSIEAWMAIAARSIAIEDRRAKRNMRPRAFLRRLSGSFDWLPRPAEIELMAKRRSLLNKVLRQLPARQMKALELAVFGGYSEQELSESLGQPLARARAEIRASATFLRHRMRAVLGSWVAAI